jgi:HK97 gp10 family phage protein
MSGFYIKMDLGEAAFRATADINKYDETVQSGIRRVIAEGVQSTYESAVNKAPYGKTGNLKTRIKKEVHGSYGKIRSTAPHSHLVEFGSGPRIVGPVKRAALKLPRTDGAMGWPGFVKGDIYNGKMPKAPFMKPAAEENKPKIEAAMEEVLKGENH